MQFHTPLNMTGKKKQSSNAECRSFTERQQRVRSEVAHPAELHSAVCCRTDVEHIDRLIFLPKKAFNSFCTWMLLPTVRYTPSCVAPKMKMGGGVKALKGD